MVLVHAAAGIDARLCVRHQVILHVRGARPHVTIEEALLASARIRLRAGAYVLDSLLLAGLLKQATAWLIVPIYLALIVIELLLGDNGLLLERGICLAYIFSTTCYLFLFKRAFRPTLVPRSPLYSTCLARLNLIILVKLN